MRTLTTGGEDRPFALEAVLNCKAYFEVVGDRESAGYFAQRERELRVRQFKASTRLSDPMKGGRA